PLGFRAWLGDPAGEGRPCGALPRRPGAVAGPGPWSFRPPSRSAKLLLFAAEATALQSSVCATPAEPGRCHAHRAHSGPRQRYEPRAARDGRDAGDTVLTPREPLRPGPTAQGAGRPGPPRRALAGPGPSRRELAGPGPSRRELAGPGPSRRELAGLGARQWRGKVTRALQRCGYRRAKQRFRRVRCRARTLLPVLIPSSRSLLSLLTERSSDGTHGSRNRLLHPGHQGRPRRCRYR